jgi:predicted HTH domain antitoxin
MDTFKVELDLPRNLLGALDVSSVEVASRLRELIALELFREGRISAGKGAELVGMSKLAFVHLLAQHDIAYFTQSPSELASEVDTVEKLLHGDQA